MDPRSRDLLLTAEAQLGALLAETAALRAKLAAAEGEKQRLRDAGRAVVAGAFATYRARNGREVGIVGDDGEMCWIVHSDHIEELRAALRSTPPATPAEEADHGER